MLVRLGKKNSGSGGHRKAHQVWGPWVQRLAMNNKLALQIALLIAVLLALYAPVIGNLAATWWSRPDYSHGFLILPVSLYLVWGKRVDLARYPLRPSFGWGLPILLGSGLLLLVGETGGLVSLSSISLIGTIAGILLVLTGKPIVRALAFPLAYLFLMMPVLDEVIAPLHWPFQLLTAQMAVKFLQLLGLPVVVEAELILLPNITLEVARVCSGVSSLLSIIAIGLPLASIALTTRRSRVLLIVSAVGIGVAANWIRVALAGSWAYFGGEVLHGPFHIFQGMFVAWVAIAALLLGAWGLARREKRLVRGSAAKPFPSATPRLRAEGGRVRWNASWGIVIVILIAFLMYRVSSDRGSVEMKAELSTFPLSVAEWVAEPAHVEEAVFRVSGADHELLRVYRNSHEQRIQLYVAHMGAQRQGKEIVNYRTVQLHQGTDEVQITLGAGDSIAVNQGYLRNSYRRYEILFWYDINGRVIANRNRAKLATLVDAFMQGRTNGALVIILGVPLGGRRMKIEMEQFVRDFLPTLRRYLP